VSLQPAWARFTGLLLRGRRTRLAQKRPNKFRCLPGSAPSLDQHGRSIRRLKKALASPSATTSLAHADQTDQRTRRSAAAVWIQGSTAFLRHRWPTTRSKPDMATARPGRLQRSSQHGPPRAAAATCFALRPMAHGRYWHLVPARRQQMHKRLPRGRKSRFPIHTISTPQTPAWRCSDSRVTFFEFPGAARTKLQAMQLWPHRPPTRCPRWAVSCPRWGRRGLEAAAPAVAEGVAPFSLIVGFLQPGRWPTCSVAVCAEPEAFRPVSICLRWPSRTCCFPPHPTGLWPDLAFGHQPLNAPGRSRLPSCGWPNQALEAWPSRIRGALRRRLPVCGCRI